ncbi:MAG: branched-chain amino acid ABC transporter permease [Bacteroidales bacterium]|nr:branched-chain amino acid ABC transporter permease [Bacteroidales bacterium]
MEYLLHLGIMLCIYVILVLSTNLTVGMANLLTMCQAAFYGIGAYVGTYFLMQFNLPFIAIALIVMAATGLTSLLVSYASVKLKGDYFILATLGFQMIIFTILYNWISVTRGPYGIPGIPSIKLFAIWNLNGIYPYFFFSLLTAALVVWIISRLQHSPYGRMLKAIRTDELSAQALGRDTTRLKSWAFFISAAFAGLAGTIYASYVSYIDPTSFTLDESIFIITALFIGGTGSRIWGAIAGAAVVVLLPELLRFVGLPDAVAANLRQIIYGLVLIVLMFAKPQGLFGDASIK